MAEAGVDPPAHWEADVVTADGGTVHVRPITADDGPALEAFHARQSAESIYFRFFSPRPRLSAAEVRHFTTVDFQDRVAFVALLDDELVGVARYDRYRDRDEAEVAFFIDDEHHGRGLATILLEYLAAAAREAGIRTFIATVLPANRPMLGVFRQAGFEVATSFADGVIEVRFDIEPTEASQAAIDERERRSEVRSVARLLEPHSVAVIGASRRRGTLGHEVLRQLVAHDFAGPVYPVNPEAMHVASIRAWPSVVDVPEQVDLAVIAVPADEVLEAVADCARARVGAIAIATAGFAEAGEEGAELERAVVEVARRHGIRLLGPASLGVVNTSPAVRLYATFAPVDAIPGRVALSLQSGTLGSAVVGRATALGLGISAFVSVGNKADVSGNDLLAWWEEDERTDVVLLSLNSFGNPHRFRRIAPRVSRRKPIVAMVHATEPGGELLLAQTGVVGVDGFEQLLDVARVLAWQPLPSGDRVAVVGDGDGLVRVTRSACRAAGLGGVELSEETAAALRPLRTGECGATGDINLGLGAGPTEYEAALTAVLADPGVDAAIVVYAAPLDARPADVARAIGVAAGTAADKPVVASFPGHELPGGVAPTGSGRAIPNIGFPDAAAAALGRVVSYAAWRRRPATPPAVPDGLDLEAARAAVAAALERHGPGRLPPGEEVAVLAALGVDVARRAAVGSADEAMLAGDAVGYPVALKAGGRAPGAKTEAAGVALDIQDGDDLRRTYERMAAALVPAMATAVVQAMVEPGVDVRATVEPAPLVGVAIGLGPGGAQADLLAAPALAVPPLGEWAAAELVGRSGLEHVLGTAGSAAVADLVTRLGCLADQVPELVVLELNPVIVTADGSLRITDAIVEVAPFLEDEPTPAVRRLG